MAENQKDPEAAPEHQMERRPETHQHDMHLVFGFYSAIFLFIFAFTGLAWSFERLNNGIYAVTNSPLKLPPPPKINAGG